MKVDDFLSLLVLQKCTGQYINGLHEVIIINNTYCIIDFNSSLTANHYLNF